MRSIRSVSSRTWLGIAFIALFAVSAIGPTNYADFVLEHVLTVAMPAAFAFLMRGRRFSNVSYTLIFLYLLLHLIGAHYTYSLVPYNEWTESLFGTRLNDIFGWERNHFDRLVHFCWGLLIFLPMREVAEYRLELSCGRAAIVAIAFLAAMSAIYEMMEWMITLLFSKEAADAYNGQQGDMFDAQKDEVLALIGSIIAAIAFSRSGNAKR